MQFHFLFIETKIIKGKNKTEKRRNVSLKFMSSFHLFLFNAFLVQSRVERERWMDEMFVNKQQRVTSE